jgi:sugar/nucleoside kinase (ribokinase family)
MLLDGDRLHHALGFEVDAVDTTGARDVFRGALMSALLRGDTPEAMLRFANNAAGISCTRKRRGRRRADARRDRALATKHPKAV